MSSIRYLSKAFLILSATSNSIQRIFALDMTTPPIIAVEQGVPAQITLEPITLTIPNTDLTITTRLLNGQLPGPTIELDPGQSLQVEFINELVDQGIPFQNNQLSAPDESNLHFHGLHISGELPSDDTTHVIPPGQSFTYNISLPSNHMPGTHWLHPHRHGSTALQVGGGAVAAVIVKDPPNLLPSVVENATEVLFVAQQMDLEELEETADDSQDALLSITGNTNSNLNQFVLVNGQYRPTIKVKAGEWTRFRIIWAAWLDGLLDFSVPGCEMYLLAKDGIYIRDFPRAINSAPLAAGNRADIMIGCETPSTTFNVNGAGQVIARIETEAAEAGDDTSLQTLDAWTPTFPDYLADLRDVEPTPGCSCQTSLDDDAVNGRAFSEDETFHETHIGAVVERTLDVDNHPYHQHVYAFQLVAGFQDNSGFYHLGDWHDTIRRSGTMRYKPTVFTGKMMVHCHRLLHEDEGMMSIETVHPADTNICSCVNEANDGVPQWIIISCSVGGSLVLIVAVIFIMRYCKAKRAGI